MKKIASTFYIFLLFFWICGNYLEIGYCFKCEFEISFRHEHYRYRCLINPDSSYFKEKHQNGMIDDDVDEISLNGALNGISHLTQSELASFIQRFKNIKQIHFSDMKSIDENLFNQGKNVKEVKIKELETESLPRKIFSDHPNLGIIFITKSKLKTLPKNTFLNQKKLWNLDLCRNQISFLPSNIFKSLVKLSLLKLCWNKIKSLNPKWFETLESLSLLDISHNEIHDLPKNVFAHLRELEDLDLKNNQLTTIHSDSFGMHSNLKRIYLSENKISSISKKIFMSTSVIMVDLRKNVCSNEEIVNGYHYIPNHICLKNYQPRKENNYKNIQCGTKNLVAEMMYGGKPTVRGENPWNVALIALSSYDLFCGGTLVSKKHVVTAAHCMKSKNDDHVFNTDNFLVLLGVHNYSRPFEAGRITMDVEFIKIHPGWNFYSDSYDSDIAILELSEEVELSRFINPICLTYPGKLINTINGTVVGFGLTEFGNLSNVAKKLDIPITDHQNCSAKNEKHRQYVTGRTFCGGPANGEGVCEGDSGGGVYVYENDTFYLRGIVSLALLNDLLECDVHKEAIFTDALEYYDFIESGGSRLYPVRD